MTLIQTVEPAAEPVTLAEAKAHLRVDHEGDDNLLGGLIRAARQEVERGTGLALIEQDWRLVLDRLPRSRCVALSLHPVREIISVTVFGSEGEGLVLDPGDFAVDVLSRPARVRFDRIPVSLRMMNGIEIDFRAGYGQADADVPDLLKRAIMMLVAHWYEFRAGFGPGDQPVSWPEGYDRLLAGYRSRRL